MNLHQMASGAIGSVNPFVPMTFYVNTGYTTADDGTRAPTFDTIETTGQFQNLMGLELQQLSGLNLERDIGAIHVNGEFDGVVRGDSKGGDLVVIDGVNWLVIRVLEQWPDWCRIAVCRQL